LLLTSSEKFVSNMATLFVIKTDFYFELYIIKSKCVIKNLHTAFYIPR